VRHLRSARIYRTSQWMPARRPAECPHQHPPHRLLTLLGDQFQQHAPLPVQAGHDPPCGPVLRLCSQAPTPTFTGPAQLADRHRSQPTPCVRRPACGKPPGQGLDPPRAGREPPPARESSQSDAPEPQKAPPRPGCRPEGIGDSRRLMHRVRSGSQRPGQGVGAALRPAA